MSQVIPKWDRHVLTTSGNFGNGVKLRNPSPSMRILGKHRLTQYWDKPGRQQSREHLQAWHMEAKIASWRGNTDIMKKYPAASMLGGGDIVFPFSGGDCRLLTKIDYERLTVLVRHLGTFKELEKFLVEDQNGAN